MKEKQQNFVSPPTNRVICECVRVCMCVSALIEPLCEYSETILSLSQTEIPPSLSPYHSHTHTHAHTRTLTRSS